MSQFIGTHLSKLDAKGRVSVPAQFRLALKQPEGSVGLFFLPSAVDRCVEVWPAPAFEGLEERLSRMDPFSQEYSVLATSLYGEAFRAEPDAEGRVVLPSTFVEYAQLNGSVAFIGKGRTFEIWEPAAGAKHLEAARLQRRQAMAGTGAGMAAGAAA